MCNDEYFCFEQDKVGCYFFQLCNPARGYLWEVKGGEGGYRASLLLSVNSSSRYYIVYYGR